MVTSPDHDGGGDDDASGSEIERMRMLMTMSWKSSSGNGGGVADPERENGAGGDDGAWIYPLSGEGVTVPNVRPRRLPDGVCGWYGSV